MVGISAEEIAVVIAAFATATVAIVGAVFSGIAMIRAGQVHKEVRTLNAKTIGVLAGETETRRIVDKDPNKRTPDDQRHLLDVPPEKSV
jgi:hypothetical protein